MPEERGNSAYPFVAGKPEPGSGYSRRPCWITDMISHVRHLIVLVSVLRELVRESIRFNISRPRAIREIEME